jgi:hypothetical protein
MCVLSSWLTLWLLAVVVVAISGSISEGSESAAAAKGSPERIQRVSPHQITRFN